MPGWHEATKELQAQGKFQMVGIIQEQHPDRCRLFMQWKQMGWPILIDSLNLAGLSGIPRTLAIDEHGIVRLTKAKPEGIEEAFLNVSYPEPENLPSQPDSQPDLDDLLGKLKDATDEGENTVEAWCNFGDAFYMWGSEERLTETMEAYQQAIQLDPKDGNAHFRLGVAYRRRHDSAHPQPGDFQKAIDHWAASLDIDPNQYIWRRRIQQFGPRLQKPYPFYDWVTEAREDIRKRGETPAALTVEPRGAEIASPSKEFASSPTTKKEPDSKGRIYRDKRGYVRAEATVVPNTVEPGTPARVHVAFRPNTRIKAHWNNEVEGLIFWVNPPDSWSVDSPRHTVPNSPEPVSLETRRVEFEIRAPENGLEPLTKIPAYALYYVCEDVDGTCLYRRQDIDIGIATRR